MKEQIIDYLTLIEMKKQELNNNPSIKVKYAWILAKKAYSKMSKEEIRHLQKKINETKNN
jgi:hypothetical protein